MYIHKRPTEKRKLLDRIGIIFIVVIFPIVVIIIKHLSE